MPSLVAKEIVLLPEGVEGLRVNSQGRDLLLPLRRGDDVSFRLSGAAATSTKRKDLCALCDGTRCLKGVPDCLVTHVVYLALFGRIVKIGVTKEERFERRIREQGAQYAARIERLPDGLRARRKEKELALSKGLRLGVRFDEKVKAIGVIRDLDQANRMLRKMDFRRGVEMSDLRHLYQAPFLDGSPRPIVLQRDEVRGRIEDTRGEALFLSYRNNLYAYDLRRTLGRSLLLEEVKTEAQLTLDNFQEGVLP